jgi:hypothetical protein
MIEGGGAINICVVNLNQSGYVSKVKSRVQLEFVLERSRNLVGL